MVKFQAAIWDIKGKSSPTHHAQKHRGDPGIPVPFHRISQHGTHPSGRDAPAH